MSTQDYPLALALEDFVPVALTGTGLALLVGHLARVRSGAAARRWLPGAGAALVVLGGSAKAVWKLIVAADGPDLVWLESLLFPCLGTGFALVGLALYEMRRESAGVPPARYTPWAVFGLCVLAITAAALVRATWPVLLLTVAASTATAVMLVLRAKRDGDTTAACLFAGWLAGMLILGPLAGRADQTVALQWVEQLCNTATQGLFALGAWRLARRTAPVNPSLESAAVHP
ncbi:hypothetical protein [Yinghuangia soli]|uniref:Uncharacterized protein n=1 Tax=Yinghuangia soli TaxID=2908204 RepID=A0AA41U556_9ACTN|nr:hypothetical protein [Yinghuangia soli]MCF2531542.1 hypothetical protein [Yinghuangia soli]